MKSTKEYDAQVRTSIIQKRPFRRRPKTFAVCESQEKNRDRDGGSGAEGNKVEYDAPKAVRHLPSPSLLPMSPERGGARMEAPPRLPIRAENPFGSKQLPLPRACASPFSFFFFFYPVAEGDCESTHSAYFRSPFPMTSQMSVAFLVCCFFPLPFWAHISLRYRRRVFCDEVRRLQDS